MVMLSLPRIFDHTLLTMRADRQTSPSDFVSCLMRVLRVGFLLDTTCCPMVTSKSVCPTTVPDGRSGPQHCHQQWAFNLDGVLPVVRSLSNISSMPRNPICHHALCVNIPVCHSGELFMHRVLCVIVTFSSCTMPFVSQSCYVTVENSLCTGFFVPQ